MRTVVIAAQQIFFDSRTVISLVLRLPEEM